MKPRNFTPRSPMNLEKPVLRDRTGHCAFLPSGTSLGGPPRGLTDRRHACSTLPAPVSETQPSAKRKGPGPGHAHPHTPGRIKDGARWVPKVAGDEGLKSGRKCNMQYFMLD